MAGVRGVRPFWPKQGKTATGILSTRGSQKDDPTGNMPNQPVMNHALGSSTRSKPSGNGNQGLRHSKHYGKKVTASKGAGTHGISPK